MYMLASYAEALIIFISRFGRLFLMRIQDIPYMNLAAVDGRFRVLATLHHPGFPLQ